MKTALVTGGSGFIGSHLCERLYNEKYNVIAQGLKGELEPKCNYFLKCDLENLCTAEFPKIDICFHQASNNNTLDNNSNEMIYTNVELPSKLFDILYYKFHCRNFVYASSCSVYGHELAPYVEEKTKTNPLNVYAKSKLLFEEFATDFTLKHPDVKVIGLRYSNVYGPNEKHKGIRASMITQMLEGMMNGKSPRLFKHGEQKRDWVYIDDVINANMLASKSQISTIYNVGAGEAISFSEIATLINKNLKTNYGIDFIDCYFEHALQTFTLTDISKISKIGYKPAKNLTSQIQDYVQKQKKLMIHS
jgi:ADP-L-glycero-D-manno-heptose 6-epimerase